MGLNKSFFYLGVGFLLGCASELSEPRRKSSAPIHPAAYSMENFTFDKVQPSRSTNDFKFFYKNCSIDERRPFPQGGKWQCAEP